MRWAEDQNAAAGVGAARRGFAPHRLVPSADPSAAHGFGIVRCPDPGRMSPGARADARQMLWSLLLRKALTALPAGDRPNPTIAPGSGSTDAESHRSTVKMGVGAGDGARTRDILLGKQTLCQLSYSRSGGHESSATSWRDHRPKRARESRLDRLNRARPLAMRRR